MARPIGTKYIESPEKMWELFLAYKKEVKDNPKIKKDWVGKDAEQVYREIERPVTMVGFECYVMNHTNITYPDLTEYFEGKNESYKDYFPMSSRIKREIEDDLTTGGLTMLYSQNITSRMVGLVDKKEDVTPQQPKKLIIKIKKDEDN